MGLFELNEVSRFYIIDKNKKKYVLKDVSLSLPHSGIVTILGKSGSGKSTLLNMIGKIDEPSEGAIFYNEELVSNFKEKRLTKFRSEEISFIFQHYHLLDSQTALYNVMLPALISGKNHKEAKKKAVSLMKAFSLNENLYQKKCADLSGGERERIAILRAFINDPKVILADEPTGALDKENALLVMEELKKRSKNALVLLITHNNELARKYSDRIIYMHDGRIVKDERINVIYSKKEKNKKWIRATNTGWLNRIIRTNFIKRFKRNMFSILSLTIGIVSSMLIFGFSNGKDASITKTMEKQFDYGVVTINKENRITNKNSPITLIQTMRPSGEEIVELKSTCSDFHICYSYDALVSPYPEIYVNDSELKDFSYQPIYSFIDESTNHNLLYKGRIPTFDTLNQVLINQKAYEALNKKLKYDSLNSYIRIKDQHSYSYYTDDIEKPYITDYFVYDRLVQIVGVVNEISFLNTPKVYYSYYALDKYMDETLLNNLSSYKEKVSWKDRVMFAADNETITNYTCRMFLKNINDISMVKKTRDSIENYAISSNALTIEETLFQLVDAASIGMEIFLGIALVGVTMIIGVISYASYNEDIKDSAILLCLGAKRDDIALIYVIESMLLGLISVVLSFVIAILINKPINLLIERYTSLISIIDIPLLSFQGHTLLFPLLIVIVAVLICLISTYLPIGFSKKISLKEELKSND